jgi:ATP-dependent helicase YprA (DUF1998 family)
LDHEHVYHQEKAIRSIVAGQTTLISTGTGSGKTECFLYPIISKALELRDTGAPEGICAAAFIPGIGGRERSGAGSPNPVRLGQ